MTRALILLALLGAASTAVAASPAIDEAARGVDVGVEAWRAVEQQRAAADAQVDALGKSIRTLRNRNDDASRRQLEDKLAESVVASNRAQQLAKTERTARTELARRVTAAVSLIDAQLLVERPRLKAADVNERVRTAQAMKALIELRARLKKALAAPSSSKAGLGLPAVEIDPLDGPEELREKADVADDQRDRVGRKIAALSALIADVRQEREVARAAGSFQRDATLFDEEGRSPRVAQKTAPARTTTEPNKSTPPAAAALDDRAQEGASDVVGLPTAGRASGGSESDFAAAPSGPLEPEANDALSSPTVRISAAADGAPLAPSVSSKGFSGLEAPSAQAAKSIDPSSLLSLKVEDLEASKADLASLEKLLAELARLESHLGSTAKQIRARAERLEADEGR
ncbi:MAG: hypothetical protein HYV07_13715 [Deltaproteobacteria bacterium]|nr:hypothetical protein [Deltaproteobacteria bacterium]